MYPYRSYKNVNVNDKNNSNKKPEKTKVSKHEQTPADTWKSIFKHLFYLVSQLQTKYLNLKNINSNYINQTCTVCSYQFFRLTFSWIKTFPKLKKGAFNGLGGFCFESQLGLSALIALK